MRTSIKSKIPGIGGKGENAAIAYFKNKGYEIIRVNYRTKFGEIDIIAQDPEKTLVFIEVKTITGNPDPTYNLSPEDNMSRRKMNKLKRICQFFANQHPEIINAVGWRIDLACVRMGTKTCKITHYENIY